jgi:hypothetical protein
MTRGIFTSEFFVTALILLGAFVSLALGRISSAEALTLVGLAVGGGLYAVGRGLAKSRAAAGGSVLGASAARLAREAEEKPKRSLFPPGVGLGLLVALVVALSGCSMRSAQTSLDVAWQSAKLIDDVGRPGLLDAEKVAARKCVSEAGPRGTSSQPVACPASEALREVRHAVARGLKGLYLTILAGQAAILVKDEKTATAIALKAAGIVLDLKSKLSAAGVIP